MIYNIHEGLKIQNSRVSNVIYTYYLPTVLVTTHYSIYVRYRF